ncbi:DoxX family protein [Mucilaginibacter segetis]|uniref:DoxX family protein n=1 Tax=Mucilaginibacter segetis TaxID=2793071 RepID=A0A934PRA3_9SPHI|nr:DoxX family protein [Mucilaginibacter segetis]MBK0377801.1 DoxX family protein [Mucilaginibacter segetis]
MKILKKVSLIILIAGYIIAGINHFINPQSYYRIMPPYLPFPVLLNILAGLFEILFATGLAFFRTRKLAAYGIILMLAAFSPIHITMIADAPLKLGSLLVTPLLAWGRLLLQPVLMLWAWWHRE